MQNLRLAYFDFTVRGEGDADSVAGVLEELSSLGAIDQRTCAMWIDALEWRELGNRLPGWTDPVHQPGSRQAEASATEEDYERFVYWRATRAVAA